MSPILVRPVREQLEHDKVIRLLQAKYKRKFEVAINPGHEQHAAVLVGTSPWYPDLVLYTQDRARKLAGTVEVETAESVNHLEAMSQWKTFAGQRVPFHLYVPIASIDTARRMATEFQIPIAEIHAYSAIGEQMRFTMVHRAPGAPAAPEPKPVAKPASAAAPEAKTRPAAAAAKPAAKPATKAAAKPAAKSAKSAAGNGRGRGNRPSTTARPAAAARRSSSAAVARRKPAAARTAAKAPARRTAAKKTAARPQKRK